MVKNTWQIHCAYISERTHKSVEIRDIPGEYNPGQIAAVIHYDFPSTNLDELIDRMKSIKLTEHNTIEWFYIDKHRITVVRHDFKQIVNYK